MVLTVTVSVSENCGEADTVDVRTAVPLREYDALTVVLRSRVVDTVVDRSSDSVRDDVTLRVRSFEGERDVVALCVALAAFVHVRLFVIDGVAVRDIGWVKLSERVSVRLLLVSMDAVKVTVLGIVDDFVGSADRVRVLVSLTDCEIVGASVTLDDLVRVTFVLCE